MPFAGHAAQTVLFKGLNYTHGARDSMMWKNVYRNPVLTLAGNLGLGFAIANADAGRLITAPLAGLVANEHGIPSVRTVIPPADYLGAGPGIGVDDDYVFAKGGGNWLVGDEHRVDVKIEYPAAVQQGGAGQVPYVIVVAKQVVATQLVIDFWNIGNAATGAMVITVRFMHSFEM